MFGAEVRTLNYGEDEAPLLVYRSQPHNNLTLTHSLTHSHPSHQYRQLGTDKNNYYSFLKPTHKRILNTCDPSKTHVPPQPLSPKNIPLSLFPDKDAPPPCHNTHHYVRRRSRLRRPARKRGSRRGAAGSKGCRGGCRSSSGTATAAGGGYGGCGSRLAGEREGGRD